MPIVGTASAEIQMDVASVAEFLRKRRSQQDVEEARAEKRAKVEVGGGGGISFQENGVDHPTSVDTSKGDELMRVEDDSLPFVQGGEDFTGVVGNVTDLSDLLRDLGDSDDDDDNGFGGDPLPEEAGLFEELLGNSMAIESEVQAQTPPPGEVQAHTPPGEVQAQTPPGEVQALTPPGEVQAQTPPGEVQAQTPPGEVQVQIPPGEVQVQIPPGEVEAQTPLINNAASLSVKLERSQSIGTEVEASALQAQANPPQTEAVINSVGFSSEVERRENIGNMMQPHALETTVGKGKSLPEVITLDSDSDDDNDDAELGMFDPVDEGLQVNLEPEVGLSQVPNGSPLVENPVKVERGTTMPQVPNVNPQVGNYVMVAHGNTRQLPNGSPQVENSVKVEQVPHSLLTGMVRAPLGGTVQMRIENGKLVPYVKYLMTPPNLSRMPMTPFGGNLMHPAIRHPSGAPTPNNGCAQETPSSGVNAPTTSAAVPSSSRDQTGPSRRWSPATTAAPTFGDQAGPSQRWNPSNNSAVVPFSNGAIKAEPGLNDGPQNQLAVVKPQYDSTVSTPRLEVARAMHSYDYYITKAKTDRAREALARTEAATPNDMVKEGHRRGLDCRPDIVAYNEMKRDGVDVNKGITVGDLPGLEVGDRFTYRHQIAVVGLHRLPNVGIDYGYPPPDMIPTATAIVLMPKAGYVDDKDYGNIILYTGQGGRKKRNQGAPFVCDQELKKGNLALAKNYERRLPVRVIRGHSCVGSKGGPGVLGYSYDGLYRITKYEFSMGMNGFNVYKFSMERLEGQPPIPLCIDGCTAHEWNTGRGALGAVPLQVVDPAAVEEDVKQLCI